jgi:uncharacterized protein YxeA
MKKMYIILSIVLIVIIGLLFLKYLIIGNELKISFVKVQKYNLKEPEIYMDWFIINSEAQKYNLEKEGYIIPYVDFNKNYLIISQYKISKLYLKVICNECTGAHDGRVIFDKENSDKDFYYFYLMPTIKLSQGVG